MPRFRLTPLAAGLCVALAAAGSASAQEAPSVANGELPAICTDRPSKANGACTVDAGHLQLETDLFNGSFQRSGGVTTDTYLVTSPTLKYGLSETVDIEANLAPYEVVRTHDKFGGGGTLGGVGDLFLRLKWNAVSSADGKLSAGVIPYIKVPTARTGIGDGEVEGGLIVPASYALTGKLTATIGPEVDVYADSVGGGDHLNTAQLFNLAYSLPDRVTVYGEIYGDWNFDPRGTVRQYSADVAVAWGVTKYFQLDSGLNIGLNAATPDVQAYVGLSQKF